MLCLAVGYGLMPYVKAKMRRNLVLRKGRPLLHYLFGDYLDVTYDNFEPIAKLLHRHGFRFNEIFNGHSTWEYILIYINTKLDLELWNRFSYDKILLLCLELGAEPNQKVNSPGHSGSTLHFMLSKHDLPPERLRALLKAFLARGAVANTKDSDGITALQLAEKNWPRAVALLKLSTTRFFKKVPVKPPNARSSQSRPAATIIPVKESLLARIEEEERPWTVADLDSW